MSDGVRDTPTATLMLEARSVALVGASPRAGSLGARMIEEVAKSPSRPRTYLVNPRYREIGDVACYRSLDALPEPVDLALLAVPDAALEDQVRAAAAGGARSAVIFGSAVDPGGPRSGPGLRMRIACVAREAGMAVCGAGCMGFVNVARGLRAVLADAAARGLPVLLLTAGASAASRSLVAAHSGALAAGDGAWQALAAAYGVHRVSGLAELADTLELFTFTKRPGRSVARNGAGGSGRSGQATGDPLSRRGLATVHDSGFERAHVVDVAAAVGVPFAPISEDTRQRLAAVLDPGLEPGSAPGNAARLGRTLTPPAPADSGSIPSSPGDSAATLSFPGDSAATPPARGDSAFAAARRAHWSAALAAGPLPAADLFAMLRDYGIPAVSARSAATREEALEAAAVIGYPVALKTDMPGISHKSDVDGVRLGVVDPAELAAAYADFSARLGPRVAVTDMAAPGWELILGMARDPALGPLIVVGAGGVLAEHLAERAVALPPLTSQAASTMLDGLRFSEILKGVRGQPPCDRNAITSAIVSFSALVTDLGEHLDAFDINPLICSPSGVLAVDALAIPAR